MDKTTKALAIAFFIVIVYAVFLYAGAGILAPQQAVSYHMMNFSTPETGILNVFAIALALAAGAIVFLVLREDEIKKKANVKDSDIKIMKKAMAELSKGAPTKDRDLEVIKKALAELLKDKMEREIPNEQKLKIIKPALTAEEKKALDEIEKAGEITQDSLRFRRTRPIT